MGKTNAWELDATVAALWRAALLLGVLVLELSSWRLDDSDFVGTCIVPSRHPSVTDLGKRGAFVRAGSSS